MTKLLSGLFALTLLAGVAAGCSDSGTGRPIGENPNRERTPSASPPTSPDSGTMGRSPSSSPDATRTPASPPTSPPTR
jgi:hypothetical protein